MPDHDWSKARLLTCHAEPVLGETPTLRVLHYARSRAEGGCLVFHLACRESKMEKTKHVLCFSELHCNCYYGCLCGTSPFFAALIYRFVDTLKNGPKTSNKKPVSFSRAGWFVT